MVECLTYRYRGHSRSDRQAYRTREEVKEWQAKDPIQRFATLLGLKKNQAKKLENEADEIINAALVFAEESPQPSLDTIMEGIYA